MFRRGPRLPTFKHPRPLEWHSRPPPGTIRPADQHLSSDLVQPFQHHRPPKAPPARSQAPSNSIDELFKGFQYKMIGGGASGKVYHIANGKTFLDTIGRRFAMRYITDRRPSKNSPIAIKVLCPMKRIEWTRFQAVSANAPSMIVRSRQPLKNMRTDRKRMMQEFIAEVTVLEYIANSKPTTFQNGRTFDARMYAPTLYYAAYIQNLDIFIIAESIVRGKPLRDYKQLSAKAIASIEKAIVSLWINGIVHRDLNPGNIVYDRLRGRIGIIDFARAVVMKKSWHMNQLAKQLQHLTHADLTEANVLRKIYTTIKDPVLQALFRRREFIPRFVHNDNMWAYHTRERYYGSPKKLAAERRKAWATAPRFQWLKRILKR